MVFFMLLIPKPCIFDPGRLVNKSQGVKGRKGTGDVILPACPHTPNHVPQTPKKPKKPT